VALILDRNLFKSSEVNEIMSQYSNDILDRVLSDIKSVGPSATTSHTSYVMGVFESESSKSSEKACSDAVLDRVLGEIKAANATSTTSHTSYVMGVFEKSDE